MSAAVPPTPRPSSQPGPHRGRPAPPPEPGEGVPLLERVREHLAAGAEGSDDAPDEAAPSSRGRAPSRARAAAWIRAGAVRVDGRVLTDPAARVPPDARLSVDLDDLDPQALAAARRGPRAPAAAATPAGVLHLDRHLVAVERSGFPPGPPEALAAAVARALAGRLPPGAALHAVPDPSAPGSGPVLLGPSAAAARRLGALLAGDGARETLLALRAGPVEALGPHEELAEEPAGMPAEGRPAAPAARLVLRREGPPGPPPSGMRDLLPPHRVELVLKHPRTNRRLALTGAGPERFLAAARRAADPS